MYYNYYVHILQSQYCLHLVELELHTLKIVHNSILFFFWSFVPNFLPISFFHYVFVKYKYCIIDWL